MKSELNDYNISITFIKRTQLTISADMPERSNGAASRAVDLCLQGFESLYPHMTCEKHPSHVEGFSGSVDELVQSIGNINYKQAIPKLYKSYKKL